MSAMYDGIPSMLKRTLGQTELQLSPIGFGASPLGDVFAPVVRADCMRSVHAAVEAGINFFDVSPYYGQTLAESRLGEALEGKRHRVVLATKCGRYGTDRFDFSPATVVREFEASLRRLRTDYVDLLQVHDVEFGDAEEIVEQTLPALVRLRDQGKVRHIGITGYPLRVLVEIAERSQPEVILSYCHWNLLSRAMDTDLTPFAAQHGIGLINASPLHMGVLTQAGPPAWHPAPPAVLAAGRRAAALCKARGMSLPEMALRFCLRHSYVASTLVGIASERELAENLRALIPSAEADALLAELEEVVRPALNITWSSGRVPQLPLEARAGSHDKHGETYV